MKIGDVLKRKGSGVVTMRSDSTIDTVVRRMRLERIGAVIISPTASPLSAYCPSAISCTRWLNTVPPCSHSRPKT